MSLVLKHFYQFGEFTVDGDQRVLLRNGSVLSLAPKVFDTLLILVDNSGRIVEKEELMKRLWPDTFVEEANLAFNIQQLRKTLGDNARKPIYIETVSRRGYRFIANVEEVLTDGIGAASQITARFEPTGSQPAIAGNGVGIDPGTITRREIESTTSAESLKPERAPGASTAGHSARSVSKTSFVVAAVFVALIALSSWLLWPRSSGRTQPSSDRLMLAVLPFENLTGDAGQDYFSDGMTEEMIAQLGRLDPHYLGVIARTSVMHYKHSTENLEQIGRELQVQYVLESSVRRDSNTVRITAQLIQIKDQTHLWSRQYDRELSSLLVLQADIAREIADEIQITLGNHKAVTPVSQPSRSPQTYEAYDLYLKGQYFLNKRTGPDFRQAIEYFSQAIARDPNYAQAYAGLADSYVLIGGYIGTPQAEFSRKARAAALRAMAIDDGLPEAHTALALIVQNYDWDWQTAEKEFRRAIELDPNYATAHQWYAEHLMWRGRFDEALRESERARQLDPLSLIIAADNGAILYFSRQYDGAIEKLRYVLDMDPNFPRAGLIMAAYVQKEMFAEALAFIEKQPASDDDAWYWASLTYIYGRSGQQAEAQRALEKLLQLNRRHQIDAAALGWAYIGIGNNDQALSWLEKAYSQQSNALTTLKVEPAYDPLRSEPRFQELLRRVGLAQ